MLATATVSPSMPILFQAQPYLHSFRAGRPGICAKVGITMNINAEGSTPPEMTAHGADRTDPASMYGSARHPPGVSSISAVYPL